MTDVELKYNPYSNETHILVSGKMLPESEVKEYVGAEQEISAWAQNFWERIATKCNDDFTVRFCGLAGDYKTIAEEFRTYKESADVTVSLEPDYIVNPDRIHDEQYIKDELDIVFGKKSVEQAPDLHAFNFIHEERFILTGLADTSLTQIVIPDCITEIGESAFRDCSSLESVVIPESVTEIGESAFKNCSSLESVVIPESVTKIGIGAFSGCSSLESVVIPDFVTEIGVFAFSRCSSLTSVKIPNSVRTIEENAFSGCSSLTSVVIPGSVTKIGASAFRDCSNLASVVIPGSVTKIGCAAFSGCSSLESVVIPGSVTEIGEAAFQGCSSLKSVELSSSTNIEYNAFPDDTVIKTYNPSMKSAAKVVGSAAIIAAGLMAAPIAFAKAVSETAQTNDRK